MLKYIKISLKFMLILFFLSFVIIGITIYLTAKTATLYNRYIKEKPFDAIIVPGAPANKNGTWSLIMKMRVLWALYLYKNRITKNIIFSGSAVYTKYYEAKIMALYAEKLGIPHSNIFIEKKAEHTIENIVYSLNIAKKNNIEHIAIATDPLQIYFIRRILHNKIGNLSFLPMQFSPIKKLIKIRIEIDSKSAIKNNFISLRERKNRKERLLGTMGKYINEDKR